MWRFYTVLVAVICLPLLTGCGFALRPENNLSGQLLRLYLSTPNPYAPLTKTLQQTLHTQNVQLAQQAQLAPYTLAILAEHTDQQVNSISATTQVIQYLLTYTLRYQLTDQTGKIVLSPSNIVVTRYFTANLNQMLGEASEKTALIDSMRKEAVYKLLNELSATIISQQNHFKTASKISY